MSFDTKLSVALSDPTPPYEQIRRQFAAHIQTGRLPAGERLPTVRQLATDLGLASGTVARAYRELETAGLITTDRARGTHVNQGHVRKAVPDEVSVAAASLMVVAKKNGLSQDTTIDVLRSTW